MYCITLAGFSGEEEAELQPPGELEEGSSALALLSPLTSTRSCETFLLRGGRVDSSSPERE